MLSPYLSMINEYWVKEGVAPYYATEIRLFWLTTPSLGATMMEQKVQ